MVKLLRKLLKLLFVAGLTSAVVFAVRALVDRISGEPGVPSVPGARGGPGAPESGNGALHGSFDSWPAVPQAPGRDVGSGSGSSSGTGTG